MRRYRRFLLPVAVVVALATSTLPVNLSSAAPRHAASGTIAYGHSPAVIRNTNGKLQIFVVQTDNQIWTREQRCAGCSWAPWSVVLGGNGPLTAQFWPAAAVDADGSVVVFAIGSLPGDTHWYLYENWEVCADCGFYGWVRIDSGGISMPPAGALSVGQNADGRLEVFAILPIGGGDGFSGQLYHTWEQCANCSGSFVPLTPLGSTLASWYDNKGLGVGTTSDGRLEVFGVQGIASQVLHAYQWSGGWSNFSYLFPGEDGSNFNNIGVNRSADSRLNVFVRRGDGSFATSWQSSPGCSTCWTSFASLGGSFGTGAQEGRVGVGNNSDGRQEIFFQNDVNHHAYNNYQVCAGCGWSGWHDRGGSIVTNLSVGQDTDGRLEIFAEGTGGDVQLDYQVCAGCSWSGWASLGNG